ncbi:hypothetical protein FKM82_014595 [Ascaphus truei]
MGLLDRGGIASLPGLKKRCQIQQKDVPLGWVLRLLRFLYMSNTQVQMRLSGWKMPTEQEMTRRGPMKMFQRQHLPADLCRSLHIADLYQRIRPICHHLVNFMRSLKIRLTQNKKHQ